MELTKIVFESEEGFPQERKSQYWNGVYLERTLRESELGQVHAGIITYKIPEPIVYVLEMMGLSTQPVLRVESTHMNSLNYCHTVKGQASIAQVPLCEFIFGLKPEKMIPAWRIV